MAAERARDRWRTRDYKHTASPTDDGVAGEADQLIAVCLPACVREGGF